MEVTSIWLSIMTFTVLFIGQTHSMPCEIYPWPGCDCYDIEAPIITCSYLNITDLYVFNTSMQNVYSLEISHNKYLKMANGFHYFQNCQNLKILKLNNNALSLLHIESSDLENSLEYLDLSHNLLMELSFIHKLKKLKVLHLEDNMMFNIPSGFFEENTELQELYIQNNKYLPWKFSIHELTHLRKLHTLYIDSPWHYKIEDHLPEQIQTLQITTEKEDYEDAKWLRKYKSLKSFGIVKSDLTDSHIDEILVELSQNSELAEKLHTLDLHGNSLVEIPSHLWRIENLSFLDLSDNLIESVACLRLCYNSRLNKINLSKNIIRKLSCNPLACSANLTYLDLRDNELTVISKNQLGLRERTIMTVLLSGNTLHCRYLRMEWLCTYVEKCLAGTSNLMTYYEIYHSIACNNFSGSLFEFCESN